MSEVNKNREAAAARIRALLSKTIENGCTEEEAIAAAAKAGELMDKYSLEMSDVEIKQEKAKTQQANERRHGVEFCAISIARFCGCKTWKDGRSGAISFFGFPQDVEIAQYLLSTIQGAMDRGWKEFLSSPLRDRRSLKDRPHRDRMHKAYDIAFSHRVNARLLEMSKGREETAKTSDGTSLVLVKNAAVEEQYNALSMKLKNSRPAKYVNHQGASEAGRSAGDKVQLNTALNGGKAALAIR